MVKPTSPLWLWPLSRKSRFELDQHSPYSSDVTWCDLRLLPPHPDEGGAQWAPFWPQWWRRYRCCEPICGGARCQSISSTTAGLNKCARFEWNWLPNPNPMNDNHQNDAAATKPRTIYGLRSPSGWDTMIFIVTHDCPPPEIFWCPCPLDPSGQRIPWRGGPVCCWTCRVQDPSVYQQWQNRESYLFRHFLRRLLPPNRPSEEKRLKKWKRQRRAASSCWCGDVERREGMANC